MRRVALVRSAPRKAAGRARGARAPLPLTPVGKAKADRYVQVSTGTNYTPGGYCVGGGMPGSMLGSGGYPMEIIQRPEQITVIYEAHTEVRRIYFGERAPDPATILRTSDTRLARGGEI